MTGRRLLAVVAAVSLGVVSAGCGVQQDEEPRALAKEGVPFDLLAPSTTTSTSTTAPPGRTVVATLYFAGREERLMRVQREVAAPAEVRTVLDALLAGPTKAERDQGVRTVIPSSTRLLGVRGPDDGLVIVNLSEDLSTAIAGAGLRLALSELVWTLTELPRVNRVIFEFAGERRDVPRGDGSQTAEPLTRRDFAQFDPTPPPPPPDPPPEPPPAEGG